MATKNDQMVLIYKYGTFYNHKDGDGKKCDGCGKNDMDKYLQLDNKCMCIKCYNDMTVNMHNRGNDKGSCCNII